MQKKYNTVLTSVIFLLAFILALLSCGSRNHDEKIGDGLTPSPQPFEYDKNSLGGFGIYFDATTNSVLFYLRIEGLKSIYKYAIDLRKNSLLATVNSRADDYLTHTVANVTLTCLSQADSTCTEFQILGPPFPDQTTYLKKENLNITQLEDGLVTNQPIFKIKMPKMYEQFGTSSYYLWPENITSDFLFRSFSILLNDNDESSRIDMLYLPTVLPKPIYFYDSKCDDVLMIAKSAKIVCHFTDRQTTEVLDQTWLLKIAP